MTHILLVSFGFLAAGAVFSVILRGRLAKVAVLINLSLGCLMGLIPALRVLTGGFIAQFHAAWPVPLGEFSISLDPLSAFFLLLICVVSLSCGVYGEGYLEASHGRLPLPAVRFFYFLLTLSMAMIVCAQNAVLFLAAWEMMALSGFFLICAEDQKPAARRAGLLYLICTHIGTLCLFALFALMGSKAGSMNFTAIKTILVNFSTLGLNSLFALALIGFGMKAGFMPLHIWLPEAHPEAPSHASAVLSGVMIQMGIYGLLRFLFLCPSIPKAWGFIFLIIGVSSGIFGILFALVQRDLKRLLAYSTIENAGIISLGMGLGCLGISYGNNTLALVGFTAAILHALNHGLFKSLLFLSAGAFYQALGSREIEGAGGLAKTMPLTSLFSWIGAAAICGLPPLNGFISEWLIYYGLIHGGTIGRARYAIFCVAGLALISGLAMACFSKAYGALTLGKARSQIVQNTTDPSKLMILPIAFLAISCLAIGVIPGPIILFAARSSAIVCHIDFQSSISALATPMTQANFIGILGAALLGMAIILWFWRSMKLKRQKVSLGSTWTCGFISPTPRMQYTASSYAQPLARVFEGLLQPKIEFHPSVGYWPKRSSFRSDTPDPTLDRFLLPVFISIKAKLVLFRRFQRGRLQYYLLSVFLFLIALFLWKL